MSDPGTGEPAGARSVAEALRAWLEHARDFRGVAYLPRPEAATAVATAIAEVDARAGGSAARRVEAGESAPSLARDPETAAAPAAGVTEVAATRPRAETPRPSAGAPAREDLRARAEGWSSAVKLAYLRESNLGDCRRCPLATTRSKIVFGCGDPDADLMFVGEAPGADEDRIGEPFVGLAGRRLTQWIVSLGLRREAVYIANVVKCRPPANRDPRPEEVERCSPFLRAQIRAVSPKVIVALGRHAAQLLIGIDRPLHQLRGEAHEYCDDKSGTRVPVVVTYHPSYVLRCEGKARTSEPAPPDNSRARKSENDLVMIDLKRALGVASARVGG